MPVLATTDCAAGHGETLVLEPEHRRAAFLSLIDGAAVRISLSMFRCTDFRILDRLADALARGVEVRLLLTQSAKGWEKKIRDLGLYLESMGASVTRFGVANVKYHAKYLVADDRRAIVGSLNLTRKCFETTADYLLVTDDAAVAAGLVQLFDHDARFPLAPLEAPLPERLILGPDNARARMLDLVRSARTRIRIADHRVKDAEVLALLATREMDGVRVEIYGKGAFPGLRSHGKMMIVDDRRAVLGSISLSRPSLDERRELAIVVDDAACVAQLGALLDSARPEAAA